MSDTVRTVDKSWNVKLWTEATQTDCTLQTVLLPVPLLVRWVHSLHGTPGSQPETDEVERVKKVTKRVRLPLVIQKDPNVILDVGVDITITHSGLRRLELKFEVTEPPKAWLVSDKTFAKLQAEDTLDSFKVKFSRSDGKKPNLEFFLKDVTDWRGFYERHSQFFRNRIIMC